MLYRADVEDNVNIVSGLLQIKLYFLVIKFPCKKSKNRRTFAIIIVFIFTVSKGQLPDNASDARTFGQYGNNRTRRQAERYSVELFTVVDYKNYQL